MKMTELIQIMEDDNEAMEILICVTNIKRVLVANVFDEGKIEQHI